LPSHLYTCLIWTVASSIVCLLLLPGWWSDEESLLPSPSGPSELRRGDRGLWTCPTSARLAGRRRSGPGVRWSRNGQHIAAVGRVTLHEDGALEIADVRSSDGGQYRCSIEVHGRDFDLETDTAWNDSLTLTVFDNYSTGRLTRN